MSKWKSHCAILGVPERASLEEIKRTFRERARRLHPDHNGGDPSATRRFQEINESYHYLIENFALDREPAQPTLAHAPPPVSRAHARERAGARATGDRTAPPHQESQRRIALKMAESFVGKQLQHSRWIARVALAGSALCIVLLLAQALGRVETALELEPTDRRPASDSPPLACEFFTYDDTGARRSEGAHFASEENCQRECERIFRRGGNAERTVYCMWNGIVFRHVAPQPLFVAPDAPDRSGAAAPETIGITYGEAPEHAIPPAAVESRRMLLGFHHGEALPGAYVVRIANGKIVQATARERSAEVTFSGVGTGTTEVAVLNERGQVIRSLLFTVAPAPGQ